MEIMLDPSRSQTYFVFRSLKIAKIWLQIVESKKKLPRNATDFSEWEEEKFILT